MSILAIHQPNYLPWAGYFYKIRKADAFVLLDHVDIVTGTATAITHRTRLKAPDGALMLTIPLKKGSKRIHEVEMDYSRNWPAKHLATLRNLYGRAPFFEAYYPGISDILDSGRPGLADLNIALIQKICEWLGISTPLVRSSELETPDLHKSELLVHLCKKMNATTYLSGNGARKYNDQNLFRGNGIELQYSSFVQNPYPQRFGVFVPGLSILDALFSIGPETCSMIQNG